MIYAIPCLNGSVGNHFSRSPQITIFDDQKQCLDTISVDKSKPHCSHRKQWMGVISKYKVEAVVVRHIGKNMLGHLLRQNIRVFDAGVKMDIDQLQFSKLAEVKNLGFGREPRTLDRGCRKDRHCGPSSPSI